MLPTLPEQTIEKNQPFLTKEELATIDRRKNLMKVLMSTSARSPEEIGILAQTLEESGLLAEGEKRNLQGLLAQYSEYRETITSLTVSEIADSLKHSRFRHTLETMFGSKVVANLILNNIDPATISDQGWYYYVPISIAQLSGRIPQQAMDRLEHHDYNTNFTVRMEVLWNAEISVMVELVDGKPNQPWTQQHEEWHILMNFWDRMKYKQGIQYSSEISDQDLIPMQDQMRLYIADCIDTVLYYELFAYLAGNTLVSPYAFAETYLSEYEEGMYPEGLLVEPIFQQQLYSSNSLGKLKTNILRKLEKLQSKDGFEREIEWLQSTMHHLVFWEKVNLLPRFAKENGIELRDLALLYQFDSDAWMQSGSSNPFDHLDGRFKQLFEQL